MLVGIHAMLAVRAGDHWALEDDEAKQVESAIKRVMRHQNMQISQQQIDYLFAAYVVAMVYGTRIATSVMGARQPAEAEPAVSASPVFPFPKPAFRPAG